MHCSNSKTYHSLLSFSLIYLSTEYRNINYYTKFNMTIHVIITTIISNNLNLLPAQIPITSLPAINISYDWAWSEKNISPAPNKFSRLFLSIVPFLKIYMYK